MIIKELNRMFFYIDIRGSEQNSAGVKAPEDMSTIMKERGYSPVEFKLFSKKGRSINYFILQCRNWIKLLFIINHGDCLIFQYPYGLTHTGIIFLKIIKFLKNFTLVFLLHDIDSLRDVNKSISEKRESLFFDADYLICHNEKMKNYLVGKGVEENRIISLEIFDYLNDSPSQAISTNKSIIIAGSLSKEKSPYIDKLLRIDRGFHINLYGPHFIPDKNYIDYTYFGSFNPDELPKHLQGSYGLVWDGDSLDKCNGSTGNYLRYNNPHKVSLYISCGIPVIIWKEAALSDFIESKELGITVNSLYDVKIKISEDKKNKIFAKNNEKESQKIRAGFYLNKALDKIEILLKN